MPYKNTRIIDWTGLGDALSDGRLSDDVFEQLEGNVAHQDNFLAAAGRKVPPSAKMGWQGMPGMIGKTVPAQSSDGVTFSALRDFVSSDSPSRWTRLIQNSKAFFQPDVFESILSKMKLNGLIVPPFIEDVVRMNQYEQWKKMKGT